MTIAFGEISWERIIRSVEIVRERLERSTKALNEAHILYAIAGGNAVAVWVSQVDEGGVRNTPDVDILICRSDLPRTIAALEGVGFVHRHADNDELFLDSPDASPRSAVHVFFANEKLRDQYIEPAPDVTESEVVEGMSILSLESLVRMKLNSFRCKDCMHLHDLINIGLITADWTNKFPAELAARLQELLDDPNESV
jgi:hypothetical protein